MNDDNDIYRNNNGLMKDALKLSSVLILSGQIR